jgi:hypothetical protein
MLSDMTDYAGGGTYFRALRQTLKLRQGQVLIHPGDLQHKGVAITSGIRILLVCFLDCAIPDYSTGVVDSSDSDENEEDFESNVVIL